MRVIFSLLVVLAIICLTFSATLRSVQNLPGADVQSPSGKTLVSTGPKGSKLYTFDATNAVYTDPVYIIDLTAPTSYDQGYDYGYLMGTATVENFDNLMKSLLGTEWWEPAVAQLISKFLDWQWNSYLKVQVPKEYLDEIQGMSDGGKAAGLKRDVGAVVGWGITLANFPSDLDNLKFILQDEMQTNADFQKQLQDMHVTLDQLMAALAKIKKNWSGLTCSMFGVWGSRTSDGRLYTGRNLDWLKDSGISKYKLVTVHRPAKGYAHATFGWAGIFGALTGFSSQGLTVHEANLESNNITFQGYPWVTRLRNVMASAQNLDEALALWKATNNTVGFNHGFGSAKDRQAVLLETMKGNTAVFYANDEREQDLVIDGQQIGKAKEEAVFRTNHGYDSYTISHYMWNGTHAYNDSITRYLLFSDLFDSYQTSKTPVTYVQALNITAIVAGKGLDHLYDCTLPMTEGSNVLSVTYDPESLIAYAAWENGTGDEAWLPAACNTYLALDFKQIF